MASESLFQSLDHTAVSAERAPHASIHVAATDTTDSAGCRQYTD